MGPRLSTEQEQMLLRRALSRQVIGIAGPALQHWMPNERALQRAVALIGPSTQHRHDTGARVHVTRRPLPHNRAKFSPHPP